MIPKIISVLLLSVLSVIINISISFCQTVYITDNGKKFHKKNCNVAQTGKKGIDVKEALKSGYEPCKICKPEMAIVDEKKKKNAVSKQSQ